MKKKVDLRASLWVKCAAVAVLLACLAGAAFGGVAAGALSTGRGAYGSFEEDPLCTEHMETAARYALNCVLDGGNDSYFQGELLSRYAGFSARIYRGESAGGEPVAYWSKIPENYLAHGFYTFWIMEEQEGAEPEPAAYTVEGYLTEDLPVGSVFLRNYTVYKTLSSLSYGGVATLTVLLVLSAAAALVYLLCAAGHRAGREGIVLNWQDRIPLDAYLLCAGFLFVMAMAMSDRFYSWNRSSFLSAYLLPLGLCLLAACVVALAALLTLAARLKKGKWWRNTVCFFLASWCWRLWKRCWNAVLDFARILPLTWRTVLGAVGILGAQFLLAILFVASDTSFLAFFLLIGMDLALVAGSAWLTRQLQQVQDMGKALAAGDLEAKLDARRMYWDVKTHAESLNAIGVGMNKAVEQRMKSERLKTELITNVSHDIKTPLTSIVNYVDLLKKEELPPAAAEYVAVLDRQSRKLKKLTEDLVEASKASTGNIAVNLEPIVVNEIVHQAIGDYDEKLAAGKLEVVLTTYEGNIMARADGRLLWRVLDNLLSNVCKYALAGTRVYVDLCAQDGRVFLTVKNISRDPLNVSVDDLMERFVRGDASRHTEGSGLGLNIARSLMDLMGGTFSLGVDGDLFKAELTLREALPEGSIKL